MTDNKKPISNLLKEVYASSHKIKYSSLLLKKNPFKDKTKGKRPLSASIEDCSFGDSGKGAVIQKVNRILTDLSKDKHLFSLRYNGTRNAGHEIWVGNARIALHQLPVGATQDNSTAIITRGMLIHLQDLLTEIEYIQQKLDRDLPSTLIIDENTPLLTDLHAAFETFTKELLSAGAGSTSSGVAPGYSDFYQKFGLTVRDLLSRNWESAFGTHYNFYAAMIGASKLAKTEVNILTLEGKRLKQHVGTQKEYLRRLGSFRKKLIPYVQNVRPLIEKTWHDARIPFTFEGAQGPGLDPYQGVYPDITASRPLARIGIPDATESVILHEEIACHIAVLKVPYMSIVGSKIPPYTMDEKLASQYRDENEETGRSTGRPRGIFPIDLVAMRAYRRAAGYDFVAITHLDAARSDRKVEIVTEYQNGIKNAPYRPFQYHWDSVSAQTKKVAGWNGKKIAGSQNVGDLPKSAIQFIESINKTLAPTLLATTGPKEHDEMQFWK